MAALASALCLPLPAMSTARAARVSRSRRSIPTALPRSTAFKSATGFSMELARRFRPLLTSARISAEFGVSAGKQYCAYAGEIPRCGQVRRAAARVRRMGMLRAPGLSGSSAPCAGPPGNRTYRHRGTTAGDRAGSRTCPPKFLDREILVRKERCTHPSAGRRQLLASCRCLAVRADHDRVEKGDILHRALERGNDVTRDGSGVIVTKLVESTRSEPTASSIGADAILSQWNTD